MKSASEAICFQEIPSEVSLSFAISNCPCHCPGCHSQYLWGDVGRDIHQALLEQLKNYSNLITCVLFMGGDDEKQCGDLKKELKFLRTNYPNLKTALYSGFNSVSQEILKLLDYVKVGPYIAEFGALKSPMTNQRLYKIDNGVLIDITNRFWEKPYQLNN